VIRRPDPELIARWAPLLLGIVSAVMVWWVWGSLNQVPNISDEAAYLFQARLFAQGRWTGPPRPLPEFFEQWFILPSPATASKYYPGQSMTLVPGVLLGVAGLMPVLLTALAGALVFVVARRVAGPWVGLLAWAIWISAPANLEWRASYYSEVTTSTLLLAAWWALLRWRDSEHDRWLLLLALCLSWGAITRPLTMLALAIPIGVFVLKEVSRRAVWDHLTLAFLLGCLVLAIVPLWSQRTTGNWSTTPLSLYTRTYLPFDRIGFGLGASDTLPPLPRDMNWLAEHFRRLHMEYRITDVPTTLLIRAAGVGRDMWEGWRLVLLPFALFGLLAGPREGRFAFVGCLFLLGAYLPYAYPAFWSVYYLEALPVLAFLSAAGIWWVTGRQEGWIGAALAGAVLLAMLPFAVPDLSRARARKQEYLSEQRGFRDKLAALPQRSIVFVRYGPEHNINWYLVRNEADLDTARVWVVHDLGRENARLTALAPDRVALLYDEGRDSLTPLPPAGKRYR
jgi:hypothetical protein